MVSGRQCQSEQWRSTITVKKNVMTTEDAFASEFHDRLFKFRRHIFNIRQQYGAYLNKDKTWGNKNLRKRECLLHVDFSENYNCNTCILKKLNRSILEGHTSKQPYIPGCFTLQLNHPQWLSAPSRRHDPSAIWANLNPMLDMMRERFPLINASMSSAQKSLSRKTINMASDKTFSCGGRRCWEESAGNDGCNPACAYQRNNENQPSYQFLSRDN